MKKFIKVTWPTDAVLVCPADDFARDADYYFSESEVGEIWKIEIVEMTQKEYEALPEFDGP